MIQENSRPQIQEFGGCRCSAVRYEVDVTDAHTLACHCRDCQAHLGSPFSIFFIVPMNQFRWLNKPDGAVSFSDAAVRQFCKSCGTYLKWAGTNSRNMAEVNVMTLDNPSILTINEEIFTRTRMPWVQPIEGAIQHVAGRG